MTTKSGAGPSQSSDTPAPASPFGGASSSSPSKKKRRSRGRRSDVASSPASILVSDSEPEGPSDAGDTTSQPSSSSSQRTSHLPSPRKRKHKQKSQSNTDESVPVHTPQAADTPTPSRLPPLSGLAHPIATPSDSPLADSSRRRRKRQRKSLDTGDTSFEAEPETPTRGTMLPPSTLSDTLPSAQPPAQSSFVPDSVSPDHSVEPSEEVESVQPSTGASGATSGSGTLPHTAATLPLPAASVASSSYSSPPTVSVSLHEDDRASGTSGRQESDDYTAPTLPLDLSQLEPPSTESLLPLVSRHATPIVAPPPTRPPRRSNLALPPAWIGGDSSPTPREGPRQIFDGVVIPVRSSSPSRPPRHSTQHRSTHSRQTVEELQATATEDRFTLLYDTPRVVVSSPPANDPLALGSPLFSAGTGGARRTSPRWSVLSLTPEAAQPSIQVEAEIRSPIPASDFYGGSRSRVAASPAAPSTASSTGFSTGFSDASPSFDRSHTAFGTLPPTLPPPLSPDGSVGGSETLGTPLLTPRTQVTITPAESRQSYAILSDSEDEDERHRHDDESSDELDEESPEVNEERDELDDDAIDVDDNGNRSDAGSDFRPGPRDKTDGSQPAPVRSRRVRHGQGHYCEDSEEDELDSTTDEEEDELDESEIDELDDSDIDEREDDDDDLRSLARDMGSGWDGSGNDDGDDDRDLGGEGATTGERGGDEAGEDRRGGGPGDADGDADDENDHGDAARKRAEEKAALDLLVVLCRARDERRKRPSLGSGFDVRRPVKGFHLSSDGGLEKLSIRYQFLRELVIGPVGVQHFIGSPKGGVRPRLQAHHVRPLRNLLEGHSEYWTVHASHATNLVSPDPDIAARAVNDIVIEMENCNRLNIPTLCIHLGEAPASELEDNIARVVLRIQTMLRKVPRVHLAIENMVRRSSKCHGAWGLTAIKEIMTRVDSPRVKACVDICHAYIAHYDFHQKEAVDEFVRDLKAFGPNGVAGFHVSDSSTLHGRSCDGHANIGSGFISLDVFRRVLRDPDYLGNIPYYLETPNYTSIRPTDHEEIGRMEIERHCLEWDFLETIIRLPDVNWDDERAKVERSKYRKERMKPQDQIRALIKRLSDKGLRAGLLKQWESDVDRASSLRRQVVLAQRALKGEKNRKPLGPRTSAEMLAMTESLELMGGEDGVIPVEVGKRYSLRRPVSDPVQPAKHHAALGGCPARLHEFAAANIATITSRNRAAFVHEASTAPQRGGGGVMSRRTRSGVVF